MKTVNATTVMSNLRPGEASCFRLVPQVTKRVEQGEVVSRLAKQMQSTQSKARYWLDGIGEVLLDSLAKNESVDTGFLKAKLYIQGSVDSASAQPTKEDNPVTAKIVPSGRIAELLARLSVDNVTVTVVAQLYDVMQDNASGVNRIENCVDRVVATGSNVAINPDAEDEGVWLEDSAGALAGVKATVSYSDASVAYFTFASLPESGTYKLVYATRGGKSAAEAGVKRLVRNVVVANNG